MFIFQLGQTNKKPEAVQDTHVSQPVKADTSKRDSVFLAPVVKKLNAQTGKKPEKAVLKGEDDRNLAAALSEINNFVSKGDKATPEDRKRLEAKLEKVYGIADYFSHSNYYSFESKNDITAFKAQMMANGIKEKLTSEDIGNIKALKEGGDAWVTLGDRKFNVCLEKGSLTAYESLDLKDAVKQGYYHGVSNVIEKTCKQWFANDNLAELSLTKAEYYYKQENYGIAAEHANQAIRLDPKNAEAYNLRGDIHFDSSAWDNAIADYTKAIEIAPEEYLYHLNRGYAYFNNEEYGKAIADFKMAKEKGADAEEMDGKIAEAKQELKPEAKTPETVIKTNKAVGDANRLVQGAKKQVMPISKVDGFYDREVARLANQTGKDIDEIKSAYTEDGINRVFKKAGDYIASQSGGNILPKDWETKLIGGELKLSPQQLAVLESVCALWLGRTEAYAKASFGEALKGDVNSVLAAIYDKGTGNSQIVKDMKSDGSPIGKISTTYWKDVVFKKIMTGVEPEKISASGNKAAPGAIGDLQYQPAGYQVETDGKITPVYKRSEIFGKDNGVRFARNKITGEMERYQNTFANDLRAKMTPVKTPALTADPVKEEAKAKINELCSLTNDIAGAVKLGVLWEGSERSELRGRGAGGRVFKAGNGKFYALSAAYMEAAGVADALVKTEGRDITKAAAPLELANVQKFRGDAIKRELVKLGVVEVDRKNNVTKVNLVDSGQNSVILGYLQDGKFTGSVKGALEGIAAGGAQLEKSVKQEKKGQPAAPAVPRTEVQRQKEEPTQTATKTVQQAYDALGTDVAQKKREIRNFLFNSNTADATKAQDAISGKGERSGLEYETRLNERLEYLASLPSGKIFEKGGSKMSAAKIVQELENHEKELAGGKTETPKVDKTEKTWISTGTWADQYLNSQPVPEEFTKLSPAQKDRVIEILPAIANNPANAGIFGNKDTYDDASVALEIAIGVVK